MIVRLVLLCLLSSASVQANCGLNNIKKLKRVAAPYQKVISQASKKYKVDMGLIYSVIAVESCFRGNAQSHKGAQGLMQLMPATAKRFTGKTQLTDKENIFAGTRYIKWLSKRFKGDLTLILAAYNSGEGAVDKFSGVPPYKETKQYVKKVKKIHNKLKSDLPIKRRNTLLSDDTSSEIKDKTNDNNRALCHLGSQLGTDQPLSQYLECVEL